MITLTAGDQTFTGKTLDDISSQLMSAQKDGSYPMWVNDEQYIVDFERDEAEFGLVPGWQRFDGIISTERQMPATTEEDLLDYARWSLNVEEVTISYEEDQ